MGQVRRMKCVEETLDLLPCPFCGGEIITSDCGYTTFNPGSAKCLGECQRKWNLGMVEDAWDAGLRWNGLQPKAVRIEQLRNELKELE